jgi:hypothetical protein
MSLEINEAELEALGALTRADALRQGHMAITRSRKIFNDAVDRRMVSRLEAFNNKLAEAGVWAQRATAFYALAAALPVE